MLRERLKEYQRKLNQVELFPATKEGNVPWIVSEPFEMSKKSLDEIVQIGQEIREFLSACWKTSKNEGIRKEFFESLSDEERKGVRRFKGASGFPRLVRPDLVIDDNGKFWITEIDLVPAFAGVLQRMQEIYRQKPTIAESWVKIVSDDMVLSIPEFKSFMPEQKYFALRVRENGGQMEFVAIEEWDRIIDYTGIIFKNCCTISLLNEHYPPCVPIKATFYPPLILDWKGWMALAHRDETLKRLRLSRRIPETYLIPLRAQKETMERRKFLDLSKKERGEWIVKPIVSWGSHGFKEGRCYNLNEWNKAVIGLSEHVSRGMILQRKIISARYEKVGLTTSGDLVTLKNLNIRVSPYYLFWKRESTLAGILVTLRQSIKVHGAQDAIFTIAVL
jgi:hypothetical protein